MKLFHVLLPAAAVAALVLAPAGCKSRHRIQTDEGGAQRMVSTIHMGDPRVAPQLVSGFHGIEAAAWRWTARKFSVTLKPPTGASQRGATLVVGMTVPPVTIEKLHDITLTASIAGNQLAPETYNNPGDYAYKRDVPANLLGGDAVRVDFELDKAMPPNPPDIRELGLVVLNIGLDSK
ncbi:MAG TPA: hypothetical protein VGF59_23350 [Bryobacteraceae bacterium]|jgi:hypothetical protein